MPVHGGFIRQCSEFVDPAFGFAIGINFWFAVSRHLPPTPLAIAHCAVGDDHSSRNHSSCKCPAVLGADERPPLGSVYNHLPRRHGLCQYLPRPGVRLHRVLHVVYQMPCRRTYDLFHVHHDIWRHRCDQRAHHLPLLEITRGIPQRDQGNCKEFCASCV